MSEPGKGFQDVEAGYDEVDAVHEREGLLSNIVVLFSYSTPPADYAGCGDGVPLDGHYVV